MNKQKFFKATERKTKKISVEGFGEVSISSITLEQRLEELPKRIKAGHADTMRWVVVQGVDGLDDSDLTAVAGMDSGVIEAIASEIFALSGMSGDAVDSAKND